MDTVVVFTFTIKVHIDSNLIYFHFRLIVSTFLLLSFCILLLAFTRDSVRGIKKRQMKYRSHAFIFAVFFQTIVCIYTKFNPDGWIRLQSLKTSIHLHYIFIILLRLSSNHYTVLTIQYSLK